MPDRAVDREPEYLRERAEQLKKMAAQAMPPSIAGQLLEVAANLEKRAARLDRAIRH